MRGKSNFLVAASMEFQDETFIHKLIQLTRIVHKQPVCQSDRECN